MTITGPDFDPWREVVNGPATFEVIASELRSRGRCIVGWTDGHGSHHDVLFTQTPPQYGSLHNGNIGPRDLFVSVLGCGAFGFDVVKTEPRHPNYVAEKLNQEKGLTAEALADLINGVVAALQKAVSNG